MSIRLQDVLAYGGGECFQRFGTPIWRMSRSQDVAATFTRSGAVGTFVGKDGALRSASANRPRVNWIDTDGDGVLDTPELVIERAGTNELTRSEDLTHADWTATGLSARTANQATGPENTATLDEIIEDSGATTHRVTQAVTGMTADAEYALSCWMIANTRTFGVLWFGETGSLGTNYVRAWFNLSTGAVGTTQAAGTGSHSRSYVEDWTHLVAGLYRVVTVGSVGNSATSIDAAIALADADASLSYTGDGSSSLYAGYAQLEDAADAASSYIATTTAAASRGVETMYVDLYAPPQEWTAYVKLRARGTSVMTDAGVLHIGAAGSGTDPRFQIGEGSSGAYAVRHDNGTSNRASGNTAAVSPGSIAEICATMDSDGRPGGSYSVDSGTVTSLTEGGTATLASAWADTRMYIGSRGSGDQGLDGILAFKIVRGVEAMPAMRALFAYNSARAVA